MKSIGSLLVLSLAVIFFPQCEPPHKRADSPPDAGVKLFVDYCARCHLVTGAGGPAPGGMSAPDIRKFTKTPAELNQIITNGFGKMPSLKDSISDENIHQIADYVAKQIEFNSGHSK